MKLSKLTTFCRNKAFSPMLTIPNMLDDQPPRVASPKIVNRNVRVLWSQSHPCRNTAAHQDHRGIRSVHPAHVLSCLLLLWFTREDCLQTRALVVQCPASTGSGWLRGDAGPQWYVGIWDCRKQKLGNMHLLKLGFPPRSCFPERFILISQAQGHRHWGEIVLRETVEVRDELEVAGKENACLPRDLCVMNVIYRE